MYIKPLSYAHRIMESDENLSVTITTYFRLLLLFLVSKSIEYFCETYLGGFSFQARERVISKIL